jgi:hypothetical protein
MVSGQTGGARSLRDLARMFERHRGVAPHLGLGQVKRATLAVANRERRAEMSCAAARLLAGDLLFPTPPPLLQLSNQLELAHA